MRAIPETIKQLLIINILFFVGTQMLGDAAYDLLALHYPDNSQFGVWQLLTHMFMHGGFTHILFNMLGLWMFGTPLEQIWGRQKFLFFYISTGLGAALLQLGVYYYQVSAVVNPLLEAGVSLSQLQDLASSGAYSSRFLEVVSEQDLIQYFQAYNAVLVGASGALYGVLVAFAFMFPNTELMLIFLPIPIKAKYFVPLLILGDLFFGFSSYSVGSIAHFAHVGGAITGFLMMWYWRKNQFNANRWDS